jgi:hypothetical protein
LARIASFQSKKDIFSFEAADKITAIVLSKNDPLLRFNFFD